MAGIRTTALILRHSTDREHDRVLTVLTPSGQLRVRARGTKKSVSKLGGSVEPLTEVDLNLADGRSMRVVTGSVIIDRFSTLRSDAAAMTMGQWLLELVEAITKPDQPAEELYVLVVDALHQMETNIEQTVGQRWLTLCRVALLLMQHEGFIPPLDRCVVCHQPLPLDDAAYHQQLGFVHRKECPNGGMTVSTATMEFLRQGQRPADEREIFSQVHKIVETLVHHTLDRPLQSEKVLRAMVRLNRLPKPPAARYTT